MHIGSYDNEPISVEIMDKFIKENGYINDISNTRLHHEIYISDPRKVEPSKMKTVIRHPIRKVTEWYYEFNLQKGKYRRFRNLD